MCDVARESRDCGIPVEATATQRLYLHRHCEQQGRLRTTRRVRKINLRYDATILQYTIQVPGQTSRPANLNRCGHTKRHKSGCWVRETALGATDANRGDFTQSLFTLCRLRIEVQSSCTNQVAPVRLHTSPHRLTSNLTHPKAALPTFPTLSRPIHMNKEVRRSDHRPEHHGDQSQCSLRNCSLGFPGISHPPPHSGHATARPDNISATR